MKKNTRIRLMAAAATLVAGGALIAGPASLASAAAGGDCQAPSGVFEYGGATICAGGQYQLKMQLDGNFVEYGNGRALWSTQTQGNPGAYFIMQSDSNAVVYTKAGKVLWASHTAEPGIFSGSTFLSVGGDGNVEVNDKNGRVVWQNHAPGSDSLVGPSALSEGMYLHAGSADLTLQNDGNLVATVAGKPVWSTKTNGQKGVNAVLQKDGNFVLYNAVGKAIWNSRTAGTGAANRLAISATGAVTLTRGATVLWKAP